MKSKVKAYEEANRSQIVIRQSQRADEERCTADRCVLVLLTFYACLHKLTVNSFHLIELHQSKGMQRDERGNFTILKRPWPLQRESLSKKLLKSC